MDDWDPKITNGLAAERDVIIFDYPGVGRSTGTSRSTVAAMRKDLVGFCDGAMSWPMSRSTSPSARSMQAGLVATLAGAGIAATFGR
jgi:pimeloyl-ACP methyl ester carboxylesterase